MGEGDFLYMTDRLMTTCTLPWLCTNDTDWNKLTDRRLVWGNGMTNQRETRVSQDAARIYTKPRSPDPQTSQKLWSTYLLKITQSLPADPRTSTASSRLNWPPHPRRLKWTRPFRWKAKYGFCACAITFQTQSTTFSDSWRGSLYLTTQHNTQQRRTVDTKCQHI